MFLKLWTMALEVTFFAMINYLKMLRRVICSLSENTGAGICKVTTLK